MGKTLGELSIPRAPRTALALVVVVILAALTCKAPAYADVPVYSIDDEIPVVLSKTSPEAEFKIEGDWNGNYVIYCDDVPSSAGSWRRVEVNAWWLDFGIEDYFDDTGYFYDKSPCEDNTFGHVSGTRVASYFMCNKLKGSHLFKVSAEGLFPLADGKKETTLRFHVKKHVHKDFVRHFKAASPGKSKSGEDVMCCPTCGMVVVPGSTLEKFTQTHRFTFDLSWGRAPVSAAWTGRNVRPKLSLFARYDGADSEWYKKIPASSLRVSYPKRSKKIGTYYAKVTPIGEMWDGTSAKVPYEIVPRATKVRSVKRSGKTASVRWVKRTGRNVRYKVRWHEAGNDSKTHSKVVKSSKKTSTTIRGLVRGKRYVVEVRCMKKVKGKWYKSKWSKPVTTKKKG